MLAVIAPGPTGEEWRAAYRELARWLTRPVCRRVLVVMGPPGAGKSSWIARQRDQHAICFEAAGSFGDPAVRGALARRIELNGRAAVAVVLGTQRWVCARRKPDLRAAITEAHRAYAAHPVAYSEGWSLIHTVEHGYAHESPWRPGALLFAS